MFVFFGACYVSSVSRHTPPRPTPLQHFNTRSHETRYTDTRKYTQRSGPQIIFVTAMFVDSLEEYKSCIGIIESIYCEIVIFW